MLLKKMEDRKKTGYEIEQTTNVLKEMNIFSDDGLEGASESNNDSLQEGYTVYSLAPAAY